MLNVKTWEKKGNIQYNSSIFILNKNLKRTYILLPSIDVTLVLKKHPNINKHGTIVTREGLLGPMTVWRNSPLWLTAFLPIETSVSWLLRASLHQPGLDTDPGQFSVEYYLYMIPGWVRVGSFFGLTRVSSLSLD